MCIFTSLNTQILVHVLGLICFLIYFPFETLLWTRLSVTVVRLILIKSTLFWLGETVCCHVFFLSVAAM